MTRSRRQRKSRAASALDRGGIPGRASQTPARPVQLPDFPTASPHFLNVNSTGRHIRPSKFTAFEPGGGQLFLGGMGFGRIMLTKTGADLQIDAVHIRAICDEIGERLRGMLRRSVGNDLPPRLRDLIQQLALLDDDVAPSLVPS